jgi:hypothetical protein
VRAEPIFAAAYLVCAFIALTAWRTRPNAEAAATAHFWLRIAVICGAFAILRLLDAQMAMSGAVRDFGHSAGLADWKRPGPYLMLVAIAVFGFALAGLFLFRLRTLHRSVNIAALAIVLLVLLAIAHSLALYVTGAVLQAPVGPLTVSRIVETILLLLLAFSGVWFIAEAKHAAQ